MRKTRKLQVTRRMLPLIVVAFLALAMVLPVLADGPPDQSGKGCNKGQEGECPQAGQQDHGQSGQQGNNGQSQQGLGQTGHGNAQQDHGLSADQSHNGKAPQEMSPQGPKGQGQQGSSGLLGQQESGSSTDMV